MELAGTAADIADAARSDTAADSISMLPLNLFGWVGEGAPSDAMAEEALRLWGGVSRTPPGYWEKALLQERPEVMDVPVLKAIFCASDAIRQQLAQSLLLVCAGAGGVARDDHATSFPVKADGPLDGDGGGTKLPIESASSLSTAVTTAPSDASLDGTQEIGVVIRNPGAGCEGPGRVTDPIPTRAAPASHDLREHMVRLLLDNIPRAATPGDGMSALDQQIERKRGVTAAGDVRRRQREAHGKDCTQLFDVLCVLVEGSIKATASERRAGGSGGDGAQEPEDGRLDVNALAANVVKRLLAHPCTERRGAKEADKDTLLVR